MTKRSMNGKKNSLKTILVIFILLVIGGVIGFVWLYSNRSSSGEVVQVSKNVEFRENVNDLQTYTNSSWGIELRYPSFLILQDTEEGYPTCHGDGPDEATSNSPWLCGLKIFDPTITQNTASLKVPFMTMTGVFDQELTTLIKRPGSDSSTVISEETTFQGYPAIKATVYSDASKTKIRSLQYDVLVSKGYILNVEVILEHTNLKMDVITQMLNSLSIQRNVTKPVELYK